MASGPLAGVKVLEFTQIIAGPFCCMHLADMGAEVTKFEPVEGEPWRIFVELVPKESRTFASLNRGKKSVAIDMRTPEARQAIHELVKDTDVVVINYRPGVAENLGIDYETLKELNPNLIYCENTAFGRRGPLAKRGGYDIIVQALTGLMAGEAKMDGAVPTAAYPAPIDYATGIQMSNSICAALYYREKTGKGQRIDISMLGTGLAMQTSQFTFIDAFDGDIIPAMNAEVNQARLDLKSFDEQLAIRAQYKPGAPGNVYYRVFQTSDGFIAIGALSHALRKKVLAVTKLHDPRFREDGTFELMPADWPVMGPKLVKEAEALYLTKTTAEWGKLFEEGGVPAGPVYFVEELFDHPQALENGLVAEYDHDLLGHLRMVGPAFQMSETPLEPRTPSPVLGADNDEILQTAGLTADTIAKLREAGSLR